MSRLNINFLGKELKNNVITSSGCFGFGEEYSNYFDVNELGAVNLKGITLNKKDGNKGTRIAETPSGMINCIGLENPGIEYFKDNIIKNIKYSTPIILNINGATIDEYVKVAEIANEIERVDFVELNISCPNVKNGGMAFGASCESAESTTKAVKKVLSKKPLIVKLSPNVTDIASIAKAVENAGADSVSLVNTFLSMKIDTKTRKPLLGNVFGGLSGACIRPIAVRMVYQVYKAVKVPIVGMGGITNYNDALEYYKKYDKEFYDLMVKDKDKLISFLNIERDSKRPRKDIATYKDIKIESAYIFNDLFYKDRNETYKDIDEKIDYDVINEYIEIYRDFNSEDDWYNQVKVLAEEMGYAPSVKMYKEDPTLYKGHIGDVCEMIRHLLTGRVKTPNLYQLLKIIGIDEFKNRVEFYKN